HFAACIEARPANREKLMSMDSSEFMSIMASWRQKFLEAASMPVIGATEEQLRSIEAPACIIAGNDRIHPPAIARRVSSLIPYAEFHDDVVSKRPENDLLARWDPKEWKATEEIMARLFVEFLKARGYALG